MTSVDESEAEIPLAPGAMPGSVETHDSPARLVRRPAPGHAALRPRGCTVRSHLEAIRPHQWLKNLLVFLPMLAAHQLTAPTFLASLAAFLSFSLIASSAYVVNDLVDLPADRAHLRKRNRPFASGRLPVSHGLWLAPGLLLAGVLVAASAGTGLLLAAIAYFALTTAYSLRLKRWALIDIGTLAGLYALRIVAGGVATGIALSAWLLVFSLFFFLALAAVKRLAELADGIASDGAGSSGRGYRAEDLAFVERIAVGSGYLSVLVMAFYLQSEAVGQLYRSPFLLSGICLVLLLWLHRIVGIARRGAMHDDLVVFAARDRSSLAAAVLIGAIAIAATLFGDGATNVRSRQEKIAIEPLGERGPAP